MIRVLILATLFFLNGCGSQHGQPEDYHMTSTDDLILKPSNHPHGYGRSDCFLCHIHSRIHQVDHLNSPNFDLAPALVKQSKLKSCSGCHGKNGVGE